MAQIWKFKVIPQDRVQSIAFPKGSKLLSVIEQQGDIILYALITDTKITRTELKKLLVVGTGWDIEADHRAKPIGTVKVGQLVFHVLEL